MSVSRSELFEAVASAFRFAGPTRDELLIEARRNEAGQDVLALVESLPARRFHDVRDVWGELPQLVAS